MIKSTKVTVEYAYMAYNAIKARVVKQDCPVELRAVLIKNEDVILNHPMKNDVDVDSVSTMKDEFALINELMTEIVKEKNLIDAELATPDASGKQGAYESYSESSEADGKKSNDTFLISYYGNTAFSIYKALGNQDEYNKKIESLLVNSPITQKIKECYSKIVNMNYLPIYYDLLQDKFISIDVEKLGQILEVR